MGYKYQPKPIHSWKLSSRNTAEREREREREREKEREPRARADDKALGHRVEVKFET